VRGNYQCAGVAENAPPLDSWADELDPKANMSVQLVFNAIETLRRAAQVIS
jgi:hypothetical protein